VRARVRDLGLEERIEMLGALSVDEMIEEYRHASVFILPSAQETSPLSIGEAMAVGVPVVATRVGGIPYLVDEGVTGHLVDVGDVASLGERVSALLADGERRDAVARAAAAAAERRFRPAAVAARVRDLYEEALCEARAA
jgi:glycosyltransferase involved in cell wall biosynthesis